MKKFYALVLLIIATSLSYAQSGVLDTSFGTNGFVTNVVSGTYNIAYATIVQPDGKIIVVGQAGEPSTYKAFATRYNTNGTLDTSFGTNGSHIIPVGAAKSFARDVALQDDGKIILAGYTWDNVSGDIFVIRLNIDGSLDNTFGTNGISIADNSNDIAEGVVIQDDGKIVLGGHKWISNFELKYDLAAVRLNEDGSFDTTYGDNGVTTARIVDGSNYSDNMLIQADGKVIIVGHTILDGEYNLAMVRFETNGDLDSTFGTDGMVNTDFEGGEDYGKGVALQPDNKIVLAGETFTTAGGSEILVARYQNTLLGTEDFQNIEFLLYPNPANEQITIEMSDASLNYQVTIFDVLGKKVFTSEIQKVGNIDVSALASGTYLVKLNSENKSSVVRFVKQ